MKDITSFYKMHPSIMIRPFQKAPEGTKSRPMRYSPSPLKRLMITIPLLKMIPSPQLRNVPYLRHFRYICPTSNPRTTYPGYLSQKSSGRNSPLRTGSSSLSTTRRFLPKTWSPSSGNTRTLLLPNTPRVPDGGKPRSISCHQGQEEGPHVSDNPPHEETSGQDQQLLRMVHETMNAPVNHPSSDMDQVLSVNRANTRTLFTKAKTNLSLHQLIDKGANGGLAGSDMRVLHHTGHKINIVGIDNHELTGLDVVTAAFLLDTNQGKVIGIFNEYAFLGKGNSIHSPGQMEYFKTRVDDKSIKVGGKQRLETLEGYDMPIIFRDGLAYIKTLGRPNDQDLKLTHMSSSPHLTLGNLLSWIMSSPQKMNSPGPNFRIPCLSMVPYLMLKVTSTEGS